MTQKTSADLQNLLLLNTFPLSLTWLTENEDFLRSKLAGEGVS
jgi:hypothetical protein